MKHTLDAGDAFLAFLEKMDEANKLARAQQAKLIEHMPDMLEEGPAASVKDPSFRMTPRQSSGQTSHGSIKNQQASD